MVSRVSQLITAYVGIFPELVSDRPAAFDHIIPAKECNLHTEPHNPPP